MKTKLLIIIVIIISIISSISLLYSQEIMLSTGMMTTTDCRYDELKHNSKCLKLEIPQHIGVFGYGIDSIVSFCEEIPTPQQPGIGLDRCIDIEYVDIDELIKKIQTNSTVPLSWPSSKMLSWCADKFDSTKHDFLENYNGCDTPDCSAEPPLISSALNDDEEFIEKGCAKFVDKWAYLTEDNDFTWHYVNWESFVKHHYESDPISDPKRNEQCAELFDLIYQSKDDSDLWYELTETNDFRDAKCASIVEEWEHLTEYNVWNIGISWDKVAENALYGCDQNEVYYSGICMTLETKERAQSIGEKEIEPELEDISTFNYEIESNDVTYGSQYQITGGSVDEITHDSHSNSLIISLNESEKGYIQIVIQTGLLHSFDQIPFTYFVIVDGEEAIFEQLSPIVLKIPFEKNTKEIEIIGTFW